MIILQNNTDIQEILAKNDMNRIRFMLFKLMFGKIMASNLNSVESIRLSIIFYV